jgi:hypothetical protein
MRSKLNQRWLIAATIWLLALLMTFWNCTEIDAVAKARENGERLHKEVLFQRRHAGKLHQIEDQHASLFKPVASVKLGFESIRSPLLALAALLDLRNVRIESRMDQATSEQMPFTIAMAGDYDKAMQYTDALLAYPYLLVRHCRFTASNPGKQAEIEMEMAFQFRIAPPDEIGHPQLQASAAWAPRGGPAQ